MYTCVCIYIYIYIHVFCFWDCGCPITSDRPGLRPATTPRVRSPTSPCHSAPRGRSRHSSGKPTQKESAP